jgi:hypothetical protein
MNGDTRKLSRRSADDLSSELCELFGQQFGTLQKDLAEAELQEYLERRRRIHQLQTELKMLFPRRS